MDVINKILTLEDLTIYPQEQILALVRQGYTLSQQSDVQPIILHTQPVQSLQTDNTLAVVALTVGIIIVGAIIYYEWWLPERYKLEAAAAKQAGVKYEAVGLTGAGHAY